jgi:hypothetical protein
MKPPMRYVVAVALSATAASAPAGVLAQVTPTLPPPFVGAPMNDNPRSGQFSLSFDNTGKLVRIGSVAVGTEPRNYPVFDLATGLGPPPQDHAQASVEPRTFIREGSSRVTQR